jgi:hypothetical protein
MNVAWQGEQRTNRMDEMPARKGLRLKIGRRLAELRRLRSPGDWLLFTKIFCFAALVPVLMRLKLARLKALLEPGGPLSPPTPEQLETIVDYVSLALRVGNPLIRPGCLTRGLTHYYFLRRAGLEVSLYFGMGRPEGEYAGHCWLVKGGEPFLETTDPRPLFTPMYRFSQESLSGSD